MKPNFVHLQFDAGQGTQTPESKPFNTAEGIKIKPCFTKADLANAEHLDFGAGVAPYLREIGRAHV